MKIHQNTPINHDKPLDSAADVQTKPNLCDICFGDGTHVQDLGCSWMLQVTG